MLHKLQINEKYKYFQSDLLNIKNIFNTKDTTIHKARNELKIIEINGLQCVVKSFKVPHIINKFAYSFLREGKARKSFNNATKLIKLSVNTPEPIGMIEFYAFGLLQESFFVSLYEPYEFTIREVFHHKVPKTDEIFKQFAKFTYEIHQKGVWHVDYSLGNILISEENEHYRFSLVDINRMIFKQITPTEGLRNFNKFWAKDKNDLIIIAKEYAKVANFDEEKAIDIILKEEKLLQSSVILKRKLKGKD